MIRTKRIYQEPEPRDGKRILVDRIWPRGMKREDARLDSWYKELAPSTALRKWFGHDSRRWGKFRQRYRSELQGDETSRLLHQLAEESKRKTITLLYGAKDMTYNNATALKDFIENLVDA